MKTTIPAITSVIELREKLTDCTLVSMDTEGLVHDIQEVGLAVCDYLNPVGPEPSYASFVEEDAIHCRTFLLREATRSRRRALEPLRFGDEVEVFDRDPGTAISDYLQRFASKPRILVVYDSQVELTWLAKNCPALLQNFSAYLDVQCLAADVSTHCHPNLRECLKALSLDADIPTSQKTGRAKGRQHRACNDAVYTLAILAALISRPKNAPDLDVSSAPKAPKLFLGRPGPVRRYPFTALIRTTDRSPLPADLNTARRVYRFFASFDPITAGTGKTRVVTRKTEQLSWSWLSFANAGDLDRFVSSFSTQIILGGKEIRVENYYIPGVTLTREESRAKQIQDGDRVREERRRARLENDKSQPLGLENAKDQDLGVPLLMVEADA